MPKLQMLRLLTLVAAVAAGSAPVLRAAAPAPSPPETLTQLSDAVWNSARSERGELAFSEAVRAAKLSDTPVLGSLRSDLDSLEANIGKREKARQERIAIVEKELSDALAGDGSPATLSKALKSAVELQWITPQAQRADLVQQERIKTLIRRAEAAGHQTEMAGQWVMANELFVRLNILLEEEGIYKKDARRVLDRLAQIRLYAPQRLWELRNQRRIEEGQKPLPPYNAAGDDFRSKLRGIDDRMVKIALIRAAEGHIERKSMRELLTGGLESVKTLATTTDCQVAFPGIGEADARTRFVAWLDGRIGTLKAARSDPSLLDLDALMTEMNETSRRTVGISDEALLHELGNGAFDHLDEFSAIIWPDEVPRFRRVMEGEFIGVGIQIQLDEETQMIKVITPIEGTPAFHGGVKAGDMLKKIDSKSAVGMTLDQAVDQITGRRGSKVTLTMERAGQDIDIALNRDRIPLKTVKGWKRTGPKDEDWDWFIDPQSRIGYVRLTGFQEDTTRDLRTALDTMKKQGLAGLVLDMRFNPGGLLTQAVSVANTFIDAGTVVYTKNADDNRTDTQVAIRSQQRLRDVPIVVLINEGAASASEIVAGAIKHYADKKDGQLRAMLVGQRTFGKGSVQNVLNISSSAMLKLTMQYYYLPNDTCIHRREHAKSWGVDPHLLVEMLPQQTSDALTLRQDADSPQAWMQGADPAKAPNPDKLLSDGLDLQLETALFILRSQAASRQVAAGPEKETTVTK